MTVTHRNKRQQPEEITSTSLRFRMVSFPILHPLALCAHSWGSHALDTLRNRVLSLNLLTISGWVCRRHLAVNEPGFQIECDGCHTDLTHSIRIKCADPVCEPGDGVDICPACFCAGLEFAKHKRNHAYRVVVSFPGSFPPPVRCGLLNRWFLCLVCDQELHSYPIFSEDWGADE